MGILEEKYTIVNQEESDSGGRNVLSLKVVLNDYYSKDIIKLIIKEIMEGLKKSISYLKLISTGQIQIFFACDFQDIQNHNWVCWTFWAEKLLLKNLDVLNSSNCEEFEGMGIHWNDDYKSIKNTIINNTGTEKEFLDANDKILGEMVALANQAIILFERYREKNITSNEFIEEMVEKGKKSNVFYCKSMDIPLAPESCKDYERACQGLFVDIDNLFICCSEKSSNINAEEITDYVMEGRVKGYREGYKKVQIAARECYAEN